MLPDFTFGLPPQKTFLFGDCRIAKACPGRGEYKHTFGGPHDRKGTSRDECNGIHIHLLHRLDLSDPAVPIAIPGLRWLPLYYCFDFRANDLGYRLLSDDALVAFFPSDDFNVTDHEEWPNDNYPLEFPRSGIEVIPRDYDPTNLDDAYAWAGIFGIEKLSSADQEAARQRVAEEADGLGLMVPETEDEFQEALSNPFIQGKPHNICLNPQCPNHTVEDQLLTIGLMPNEPVEGVHLFGHYALDFQLIFQMCRNCHTIRVSNQCT